MISTGPFAQLPVALLESQASHGATRTYAVLSLLPRQEGNQIWMSQNYVADQLNCSTRQLRNYLKELITLGFLEQTEQKRGANRVYRLLGCEESGNVFPPIELNLNSNSISNSNCRNPASVSQELIQQHGTAWSKEFSCFDGKEGRAMLSEKVEEAVKRFKYGNLLSYVRYYLSQGAKWLVQAMAKLYGVVTEKPFKSLSELKQARQEAEQRRKAYGNRFMLKETVEVSQSDQAFIREEFAKLRAKMGFRQRVC
ncbi:MAG: helix-turn-helix domain-containing protein [Deltaproteobacteria bacterium]|nr:helix-turn-helix domain-containing protein [Deltaproteobacteria bacterium]